jgi:alpha-N-arabinofuranosidase
VVAATLSNAGPRVYTSVTRDEKRRKLFVKLVNAASDAAPLNITLEGAAGVGHQATLVTLSGKSPNATNTINRPDAVIPVEQKISIAGAKFEHRFAPYSINVLELTY